MSGDDCTMACVMGHTYEYGCVYASFFLPRVTYRNAAAFAGTQQVHRFRCLAVEPHPGSGEMTAIGWIEFLPGMWKAGAIEARDYHPENWSEI